MATLIFAALLIVAFVNLSVGSCPDGWMRHGPMCYHFSSEVEDWPGAKIMCEAMKGQLVEIETQEENHFLGQQAKLYNKYFWTALSDVIEEDTWVWMNSRRHATFTNWKPGEPNNSGIQNCVNLYASEQWNDAQCRSYFNYICEKPDQVEVIG